MRTGTSWLEEHGERNKSGEGGSKVIDRDFRFLGEGGFIHHYSPKNI